MRASDRMTLAVAIAVMLSALTFRSLTTDRWYIAVSWVLIVVVAVATLMMRRARLAGGAVVAVQLLIVVGFVIALAALVPGSGEPWYDHYTSLWLQGIEHMQTQSAPMVPNDGVTVIFVTVLGLILLLTDLLVSGLSRPVWGFAPPLALYLVPAIGLGVDTGAFSFVCLALGYLGILLAEGLNTTARWTRGLSRDSADGMGTATPVVWRAAGLIGAPVVVAALVLGGIAPTLSLAGLGLGAGSGSGGQLQLTDPTLDLRRNLNQPRDQVVITYATDRPGGLYLRMASLPELNNTGWHNISMKLTEGDQLPAVPGLTNEPQQRRRTDITVRGFSSQYLPLPYAPRSFAADGEWAYDTNSLVVISNTTGRGRNDAIRGLSYSVQSVDVSPTADQIASAVVGQPADNTVTGKVPDGLPAEFTTLTKEVIDDADATTPLQQAAAIQAYLRSNRFTYDTDPQPGTGYEALRRFLFEDRRGYCEQFAGAMAMMARTIGIPSRVAVGFLPGKQQSDKTWQVSIRDMHAWPELYFAELGWVRFEPTPSGVTGSPPAWTVNNDPSSSEEPTTSASARPSASSSTSARPEAPVPTQAPTTTTAVGAGWLTTVAWTVGALVVLLILAAPATIRVRRRAQRLSGDGDSATQVESAWAEIRDTVVDYGGSWPSGSPQTIGTKVGERLDPDESEHMGQVATLVERSRYARSVELGGTGQDLPAMTRDIRRGLAAPRSRFHKALAVIFPRSLFKRSPRTPKGQTPIDS